MTIGSRCVAAGQLGPETDSEEAVCLVSTLIEGVLTQAMANEPDLEWGRVASDRRPVLSSAGWSALPRRTSRIRSGQLKCLERCASQVEPPRRTSSQLKGPLWRRWDSNPRPPACKAGALTRLSYVPDRGATDALSRQPTDAETPGCGDGASAAMEMANVRSSATDAVLELRLAHVSGVLGVGVPETLCVRIDLRPVREDEGADDGE
jgi:hypothetical protein